MTLDGVCGGIIDIFVEPWHKNGTDIAGGVLQAVNNRRLAATVTVVSRSRGLPVALGEKALIVDGRVQSGGLTWNLLQEGVMADLATVVPRQLAIAHLPVPGRSGRRLLRPGGAAANAGRRGRWARRRPHCQGWSAAGLRRGGNRRPAVIRERRAVSGRRSHHRRRLLVRPGSARDHPINLCRACDAGAYLRLHALRRIVRQPPGISA